ncbi:hypothetical protein QBC39DRAFT_365661 [Podospora conica]|nr:hypothetical protein QBC39DRAFT_365661 [Schizothecium conicum]
MPDTLAPSRLACNCESTSCDGGASCLLLLSRKKKTLAAKTTTSISPAAPPAAPPSPPPTSCHPSSSASSDSNSDSHTRPPSTSTSNRPPSSSSIMASVVVEVADLPQDVQTTRQSLLARINAPIDEALIAEIRTLYRSCQATLGLWARLLSTIPYPARSTFETIGPTKDFPAKCRPAIAKIKRAWGLTADEFSSKFFGAAAGCFFEELVQVANARPSVPWTDVWPALSTARDARRSGQVPNSHQGPLWQPNDIHRAAASLGLDIKFTKIKRPAKRPRSSLQRPQSPVQDSSSSSSVESVRAPVQRQLRKRQPSALQDSASSSDVEPFRRDAKRHRHEDEVREDQDSFLFTRLGGPAPQNNPSFGKGDAHSLPTLPRAALPTPHSTLFGAEGQSGGFLDVGTGSHFEMDFGHDAGSDHQDHDMESLCSTVLLPSDAAEPKDATAEPMDATVDPNNTTVESKGTTVEPKDATVDPNNAAVKPKDATETKDATLDPNNAAVKSNNAAVKPNDATTETKDATIEPKRASIEPNGGGTVEAKHDASSPTNGTIQHNASKLLDIGSDSLERLQSPDRWIDGTVIDHCIRAPLAACRSTTMVTISCLLLSDDANPANHGRYIDWLAARPKDDLEALAPVNTGNHWVLAHLRFHNRQAMLYDSNSAQDDGSVPNAIKHLQRFLTLFAGEDASRWTFDHLASPQQVDGSSCGIFAIATAWHLVVHQPLPGRPYNQQLWRTALAHLFSPRTTGEARVWPFSAEEDDAITKLTLIKDAAEASRWTTPVSVTEARELARQMDRAVQDAQGKMERGLAIRYQCLSEIRVIQRMVVSLGSADEEDIEGEMTAIDEIQKRGAAYPHLANPGYTKQIGERMAVLRNLVEQNKLAEIMRGRLGWPVEEGIRMGEVSIERLQQNISEATA